MLKLNVIAKFTVTMLSLMQSYLDSIDEIELTHLYLKLSINHQGMVVLPCTIFIEFF